MAWPAEGTPQEASGAGAPPESPELSPSTSQFTARFGGIQRLFGERGAKLLSEAHVCVVGIGGVGSWAVEALARSGIGEMTLVDLDDICVSNVNRQLHALTGTFGKLKVEVMADRARAIHPGCKVHPRQEFFLKSNAETILATRFHYVIDAIDSPARKCLLIALCRQKGIPVVTTGAAAGRRNPAAIEVRDLAFSSSDRLLQEVRKKLRVRFGFPRGEKPFGVECVFSCEPVVYPGKDGTACSAPGETPDLRLDCDSGLGTASFVTGVFGLVAAARVVQGIAGSAAKP